MVLGAQGNSDRRMRVLLGKGNGKFSEKKGFYGPVGSRTLSAADFNGDGHLDLYVGAYDEQGPYFQVLLGNGDGSFSKGSGQYFDSCQSPPAMGDFNADGLIDISALDTCDGVADVFLNSKNGFQGATSYPITFGGDAIAAADVNGDGILDLVTDGVSVLLGNGDGTFRNTGGISSGASGSVNIGDFNGDGTLDVLAGASVLLGDGSGNFQGPLTFAGLASGFPISIGGFNADGGLDLLGIDALNGALTIAVQIPVYLTPANLDFGEVAVGTTSPAQTAALTNFGTKPLTGLIVNITGTNATDFAQSNNCGTSLPPNGSCKIQVTFAPSLVGSESAVLNVTYKGSGPVSLPPEWDRDTGNKHSDTHSFEPDLQTQFVGTTSPSQLATLTNTGNQPIAILSIVATSPFGQTNNCPATLPVGETAKLMWFSHPQTKERWAERCRLLIMP